MEHGTPIPEVSELPNSTPIEQQLELAKKALGIRDTTSARIIKKNDALQKEIKALELREEMTDRTNETDHAKKNQEIARLNDIINQSKDPEEETPLFILDMMDRCAKAEELAIKQKAEWLDPFLKESECGWGDTESDWKGGYTGNALIDAPSLEEGAIICQQMMKIVGNYYKSLGWEKTKMSRQGQYTRHSEHHFDDTFDKDNLRYDWEEEAVEDACDNEQVISVENCDELVQEAREEEGAKIENAVEELEETLRGEWEEKEEELQGQLSKSEKKVLELEGAITTLNREVSLINSEEMENEEEIARLENTIDDLKKKEVEYKGQAGKIIRNIGGQLMKHKAMFGAMMPEFQELEEERKILINYRSAMDEIEKWSDGELEDINDILPELKKLKEQQDEESCDCCDGPRQVLTKRDAGYDEWTCLPCHKEQYPEEYE